MKNKKPMIILAGPTAVGKTSLSIQLAKHVGGEIISADSMQVYRHMDVGTAKVKTTEMDGIRHHLIDVLDPWEEFNVTIFQSMAKEAVAQIYARNRIPIITGGTGFYIQALLYDINFTETDHDKSIRQELELLMEQRGPEYLHQILSEIDPESATAIHFNNKKRVIRAIEYFRQTGQKISLHNQLEKEKQSNYDFIYYVIHTDRPVLYDRIDGRVDQMIKQGLVNEVKALVELGCKEDMISMQGLGYKEICAYLKGECSLDEAIDTIKRDTRHFAKRQLTWFKREREVSWLYLPDYQNTEMLVLEKMKSDISQKWNA